MQAKNVDLLSFDHGLSLIFKTKTIVMIIHAVIPGTQLKIMQILYTIERKMVGISHNLGVQIEDNFVRLIRSFFLQ